MSSNKDILIGVIAGAIGLAGYTYYSNYQENQEKKLQYQEQQRQNYDLKRTAKDRIERRMISSSLGKICKGWKIEGNSFSQFKWRGIDYQIGKNTLGYTAKVKFYLRGATNTAVSGRPHMHYIASVDFSDTAENATCRDISYQYGCDYSGNNCR